ncbi:hypothetical protein [Microbacterium sp. KR10-403]|uniref:hypothetical protein n=1 Tax=Microbacterium sp. KR10-403 TaxID=3158581 RepID=UPI0032E424A2
MSKPRPPIWPTAVIVVVGGLLTVLVLAWMGSTYDDHGKPLLDDTLGRIIAAGIGGTVTTGAAFAQRALTQLHPNHGSSLADMSARSEEKLDALITKLDHLERAHRKNGDDIVQLREDQQQTRVDLAGQASDIRGIRKDIAWVRDAITQKEN